MLLSVSSVCVCVCVCVCVVADRHFIVWIYHILFIHSLADGHFSYFLFVYYA